MDHARLCEFAWVWDDFDAARKVAAMSPDHHDIIRAGWFKIAPPALVSRKPLEQPEDGASHAEG